MKFVFTKRKTKQTKNAWGRERNYFGKLFNFIKIPIIALPLQPIRSQIKLLQENIHFYYKPLLIWKVVNACSLKIISKTFKKKKLNVLEVK